ncbi:M24 family metallopeptidase [Rheinheimera texasensis]|uniref:M24 family metallopeptidase n=1 Tax=Rheinheimera texasensis TaxID=306205 RepID=UPI0004E1AA76|nr:M24 family metallopeptidase [Rheinheimera texasensis]
MENQQLEQQPAQRVGAGFSLAAMQQAQQTALDCLHQIAARLEPGILEADAIAIAKAVLQQAGAEQHWHPPIIRFGHNTAKIYSEPSAPDSRLCENDIFFIDLGPVFAGHEADVGATFCVGNNPVHQHVQQAAHQVFALVAAHWRATGCSGASLYQVAADAAAQQGMVLNHQIKGHRVGDFPHKLYASGQLGGCEGEVRSGIWVLEIQLLDPASGYGGFVEQVLF